MPMIGAIVGDIVGSRFEFNNNRSKFFVLFDSTCGPTDDSIMTISIMDAILKAGGDIDKLGECAVKSMREIGQHYPDCGFGGRFYDWMFSDDPKPYGSYGNGAAMRVSPVAYFAKDIEDAKKMSKAVTEVTHNHPEGIKGAECTAVCVWAALHNWSKEEIEELAKTYYDLDFTLDEIRDTYKFNETCQRTVPQAIEAFLESTDFEDAIRNAISIGGDSDTVAAITGAVAGAFYGVPDDIRVKATTYLDKRLSSILRATEESYTAFK